MNQTRQPIVPDASLTGFAKLVILGGLLLGLPSCQRAEPASAPDAASTTGTDEFVPASSPAQSTPAPEEQPMAVTDIIIEDLVIGTGPECPVGATVEVHYKGTLMDGTTFDSSYDRGESIVFPLGNLIQGWQEGIPGMKVGGKRKLTIPYKKAYGERGIPGAIPPKADLIFEIELLGVK